MTTKEQFEALHPDIIQNFRLGKIASGIPDNVQRFILAMDEVPEYHRRHPNISKCCRVLMEHFPEKFTSFRYAQEIVYASINYFHLNNTVKNAAWDMYYADKMEDYAQAATLKGNIDLAMKCTDLAHKYRTNRDESAIDSGKLAPNTYILSPDITPELIGLRGDIDLKTLWKKKRQVFDDATKFINGLDIRDEQKTALVKETAENLNFADADYEELDSKKD
jgi:hypothetical protein